MRNLERLPGTEPAALEHEGGTSPLLAAWAAGQEEP
jgi:hypothetical protein